MNTRLTYPELSPVPGSESMWVLKDDFDCWLDSRRMLSIKAGFRTDGQSIQAWAWPLVGHPFAGKGLVAGLVHDALYATHYLTRSESDAAFRVLQDRYNVCAGKRWVKWAALRLAGWAAWRRSPQSIAAARRYVSLSTITAHPSP